MPQHSQLVKFSSSFHRNFVNAAGRPHRLIQMDIIATTKYKNQTADDVGHQYNFQHIVLVTKYRYKMFRNPKTTETIRSAFYDVAGRYKMIIKELSFGEDFAHAHLEVSIPNTMSIAYAVQLLKGFSSYIVFKKISNHRLRYQRGHFWTA